MLFQLAPVSTKTVWVIATAIGTPVASGIVDHVLAAQPVLKLLSQGILWGLSVVFVFLGVLNRWKEYQLKSKQLNDEADKGTP